MFKMSLLDFQNDATDNIVSLGSRIKQKKVPFPWE